MKTTFNPERKNFTRATLGVNMLNRWTPDYFSVPLGLGKVSLKMFK